jgi:uncharacterized protein YqhQ
MVENKHKKLTIGGQAVIEGVMMRSENYYSIATNKNKKIIVKTQPFKSWQKKNRLFSIPFIRGIVVLIETLILGIKTLIYSSNVELGKKNEKFSWWQIALTLLFSFVFALAIFKLIPLFIANLIKNQATLNTYSFNLIEGGAKLAIFIIYILIISSFKDVRRLFQYHGAEHKSVTCYEAGEKLTVKNVKKYSTLQPRCGSSFILMVIFVSIIVYLFIPFQYSFWTKYLLRILLLPIIAGISYELIKLAARHPNNLFFKIIISPGLLVQKLTTKEPDIMQMKTAIAALTAVLNKANR